MNTESTIPEFIITRDFDAPREVVYAMWTEPRHMSRWWGPRVVTTSACEMDVNAGGAYRIVMRAADGSEYPITGVYREIVKSERLVMTMDPSGHPEAWHDLVKSNRSPQEKNPAGVLLMTVTFEDIGGKTRQTVHIRFESTAIRDAMMKMGMNEGWSQSLERLSEIVGTAQREIVTTRVFKASRDLVWLAWTDPKHLVQWWGPNGFTTTMQEMDVRPGGNWNFIMHGPDGRDYQNKSLYVEVVKPERLVYDHAAPKFRATATFEEHGDGTKVTLRMVFESEDECQNVAVKFGAIEGAQQTFRRMGEQLEKMQAAS